MKLLLFDLDGTLLDNEKNISKRTLAALHKCSKKLFDFFSGASAGYFDFQRRRIGKKGSRIHL